MQIGLFWNSRGNFLNMWQLIFFSMSSGLARPLLPSVFAFMGEEWNDLPLPPGDIRTLSCVVFAGLYVCLLHRYLLTSVYQAL